MSPYMYAFIGLVGFWALTQAFISHRERRAEQEREEQERFWTGRDWLLVGFEQQSGKQLAVLKSLNSDDQMRVPAAGLTNLAQRTMLRFFLYRGIGKPLTFPGFLFVLTFQVIQTPARVRQEPDKGILVDERA